MISPNLSKWADNPQLDGLLYFAQLLDDMLFDYTLDSYKLPALNAHSLSLELESVASEVTRGVIHQENLRPVAQELAGSLQGDLAARAILGNRHRPVCEMLRKLEQVEDAATIGQYLSEVFGGRRYLSEVKNQLMETTGDPKRKDDIRWLASSLVLELLREGYTHQYVYFLTKQFFFGAMGPKTIASASQIGSFLDRFTFSRAKWDVVAKGTADLRRIRPLLAKAGLLVSDTPPPARTKTAREARFLTPDENYPMFLTLRDVLSLDSFGARNELERLVYSVGAIARQYTHRHEFAVHPDVGVYSDKDYFTVLSKTVPPLLKTPVPSAKWVSEVLDEGLGLPQPFLRALELHSAALDSRAVDTQFLTLWAALEGFLPAEELRKSRLRGIVAFLRPVLCRGYVAKLLIDLQRNLENCAPEALAAATSQITDMTPVEKLAAVVAIDDLEPLRKKLYEGAGRNVLLRHRVWRLKCSLDSAVAISSMLTTHWTRDSCGRDVPLP